MFLEEIAARFDFDLDAFNRIKLRHMGIDGIDPYVVLGASADWEFAKLKSQYRKRISESHPDRLIARGVPPEFIVIATDRLATLNVAWEQIEAIHASEGRATVSQ